MILSAPEIKRRLDQDPEDGGLIITPYEPACQQPASYDLRAAETMTLPRGVVSLVPSIERVGLPVDLAGTLMCRSSLGRRGVLLGAGFVDPGFRGNLTLCLTNTGKEEITVKEGDRIVQMILHEVLNGRECYSGHYQDSSGAVEVK